MNVKYRFKKENKNQKLFVGLVCFCVPSIDSIQKNKNNNFVSKERKKEKEKNIRFS